MYYLNPSLTDRQNQTQQYEGKNEPVTKGGVLAQ